MKAKPGSATEFHDTLSRKHKHLYGNTKERFVVILLFQVA